MTGCVNIRDRGSHLIHSQNRAASLKLFLCSLAMVIGASIGQGQPIPDTVLLPDSLGPLRPGYHLAFGSSTNNIYVASESSDIIVVDWETFQRIKRINTGTPVGGALLVSQHNKLYCSYPVQGRVGVIGCATNSIVGSIQVGTRPKLLCYSSGSDKLYCGDTIDHTVSVIDCTADTVLKAIPVGRSLTALEYDPRRRARDILLSRLRRCQHPRGKSGKGVVRQQAPSGAVRGWGHMRTTSRYIVRNLHTCRLGDSQNAA
jgi:DNA-binding beta-propeller fold protein YncE